MNETMKRVKPGTYRAEVDGAVISVFRVGRWWGWTVKTEGRSVSNPPAFCSRFDALRAARGAL